MCILQKLLLLHFSNIILQDAGPSGVTSGVRGKSPPIVCLGIGRKESRIRLYVKLDQTEKLRWLGIHYKHIIYGLLLKREPFYVSLEGLQIRAINNST